MKAVTNIAKRRGRPPIVKHCTRSLKTVITTIPTVITKKRGRPPKNIIGTMTIVAKKRGRPRKNIITEIQTFKTTTKSFENNENKNLVNNLFSSFIALLKKKQTKQNDSYVVGALDGIERNTSNCLLSLGIRKEECLLVEYNKEIANSHISVGFATYSGSLEDFAMEAVNDWKDHKCLGWYFDMCQTIATQKEGIFNTIRNLNLIDGSVLAFTFCRRGMTIEDYYQQRALFINELSNGLKWKGFTLVFKEENDYSGKFMFEREREAPMNSFIYILQKL